ncbi:hypothetical protein CBS101457_002866 [Exobasidium rhododendri]|nr:hypothetical protein CBS101457_002866 [Exobasidium rhododendri]
MLSNVRIIHPPSSDNKTNLAVLLFSIESQRYIFNCPEGTTRAFVQQSVGGLGKGLGNIFLPRVGIEECGGLPGLVMGAADAGHTELTIHGPPVLTHYLATTRSYLRRDAINVQVKEAPLPGKGEASRQVEPAVKEEELQSVIFKDQYITVQALPLLPSGYSLPVNAESNGDQRPSKRRRSSSGNAQQFLQLMFPNDPRHQFGEADQRPEEGDAAGDAALRNKLAARAAASRRSLGAPPMPPYQADSSTTKQAPVLLFIIRGRPIRGKVDVERARELGVPQGAQLGILTSGSEVKINRPKAWATYQNPQRDAWFARVRREFQDEQLRKRGKIVKERPSDQSPAVETEEVLIKSTDVLGATRPGASFFQVYLPSIEYLDSFLAEDTQSRLKFEEGELHAIVHAVHPDVLQDRRYQTFIKSFNGVHHIITSQSFLPDRLSYPSSALATLRMSRLDKKLFQVPAYNLEPEMKLSSVGLEGENMFLAGLDTSIVLHPRGPPHVTDEVQLDFNFPLASEKAQRLESFEETPGRKQVTEESKKAKQEAWRSYVDLAKSVSATEATQSDQDGAKDLHPLKLTTLGTGSAMPSKYRNVSGTLIHLPGENAGYVLLDAGESTYGQLKRKFHSGADDVIANIRMIFLSHIHGDHHMGVSRILVERSKLNVQRPLFVVAPSFIRQYLKEANEVFSMDIQENAVSNGVVFIQSHLLDSRHGVVPDVAVYPEVKESSEEISGQEQYVQDPNGSRDSKSSAAGEAKSEEIRKLRAQLVDHLHGTEVFTTEVDHRAMHCYGIVFRGKKWSGAYSGDTRPTQKLIKAGSGVDFLVHEATIEDSKPDMADYKGHSTFGQAIEVAKAMKVKYLMLTHFSQRYPKLPRFSATGELGKMKVGIAFDLLTVEMSDLQKLMKYKDSLELLFDMEGKEEEGEGEGEAEKGKGTVSTTAKSTKEKSRAPPSSTNKASASKIQPSTQKDTPMAVDQAPSENSKDANGEVTRTSSLQRKFVKTHEFQYLSFDLKPTQSKTKVIETSSIPSRLTIAKAVETALVDLNGLVNGSFNWDLLHILPVQENRAIRVLVKVPFDHLHTLRATISTGLVVQSSDKTSFSASVDRTFSSLDLVALETDKSREWFDSIVGS